MYCMLRWHEFNKMKKQLNWHVEHDFSSRMLTWYQLYDTNCMISIVCWCDSSTSYQLLLAIECLHHLYHTSHLLMYILFQDAQASHSHGMWCGKWFLLRVQLQANACSSLQASQEKLMPVIDGSIWQPLEVNFTLWKINIAIENGHL